MSILALVVGCLGTPQNVAAAQPLDLPGVVEAAMPETGAPTSEVAASAFTLVESWLRSGQVPERMDGLPEFSGVSICLRMSGAPIARTVIAPAPGKGGAGLLVQAAADVHGQLLRTRRDAAPDDRGGREWVRAMMGNLTVTLEVAGPLVPFTAQTYDDVDMGISPGCQGVGCLAGARFDSVFPLAMIETSMSPGAALRAAIAGATGDAKLPLPDVAQGSPGAIARSHGARYYRFRTTQVAQMVPRGTPIVLHRGGQVFEKARLSRAEVEVAAARMADHLAARLGDVSAGLAVRPVTHADPAGTRSQAVLSLIALARHAHVVRVAPARAELLRRAAGAVLGDIDASMAAAREKATKPLGLIEASLMTVFLTDLSGHGQAGPPVKVTPDQWTELAVGVRAGFDAKADGFHGDVPEAARGLVALALLRLSACEGAPVARKEAQQAIRAVYRGTTPATLAAQMPWLGWAELELAGATGEVGAAGALIGMREEVLARAITTDDAGEDDADMVGGLVGATGGSVLPTWHTARPMCFVASSLRDRRLTGDAERTGLLIRVLGPVRFTRQLMVDEAVAMLVGEAGASALGGVRSSVWDVRQPPDATAFGLMLMTESLRAFDAAASP